MSSRISLYFGLEQVPEIIAAIMIVTRPVTGLENNDTRPIRRLITMKMTPTIQTQPHALKQPTPMQVDDTDYKEDDAHDRADCTKPDHCEYCTAEKGGDEPHQSEEDP